MRLLASAALAATVPFVSLASMGCLSDDNATEDAGAVDASVDTSIPIGPVGDSGSPDRTVPDGGTDATASDAGADTSAGDAADASDTGFVGDAGTATARLVNLVPDLGSAIDVCAAYPGGALAGPFLKLAGVTAGLAYGEMTTYVSVPAHGRVRVVAANAADCSTPLVADDADLAAVDGARVTAALMGSASDAGANGPAFRVYSDDDASSVPTGQGVRIRIVHAAPATPATDFVFGAGAFTFPQHAAVAYGAATSAATMAGGALATDANGYFTTTAFTNQVTATRGGTDVTSFVAYLSHAVSAFFTGIEGSATTPPAFVVCDDAATPTGFKVPCTLRTGPPTMSTFRQLHASPALATFDFCLSLPQSTTQHGPMVKAAGVAAGLAYKELSGSLATVPTDTSFLFKYIAAGGACSDGALIQGEPFLYGQPGVTDQTVVAFEGFGAGGPNGFGADAVYTSPAASASATLLFNFFDGDDPQTARLDLFDTPASQPEETIFTGIFPLNSNITKTLAPGNYGMRVAVEGGATTYTGSGVQLGAGSQWLMTYVETSATAYTLLRCNLAPPAAGTNRACLE